MVIDCLPETATVGACKFNVGTAESGVIICSVGEEGNWTKDECDDETDGAFSTKCPTSGVKFTCTDTDGDEFKVYTEGTAASWTDADCSDIETMIWGE